MQMQVWELFTFSAAGPEIVFGFMKNNMGVNELMKPLCSTMLSIVADSRNTWEVDRLKFVVRTLKDNRNQIVLNYVASTIWCLARNESNRRNLGKLYAIHGLLKVLKTNSEIALKERIVGTLWLLCCDR